MAKITYVQTDGTKNEVDVPNGQSIKDGAVNNLVPGILAECGGACACATCQVYVDDAWFERVGAADGVEKDMLDFAFDPKETSRLSCQVDVTDALDGLVVHVPEEQ
jgi:ferredoxin, 2Fe-2S